MTEVAPDKDAPLITTHFVIAGWDFDTDVCTKALGLTPTKIWRQRHAHLAKHPQIQNTNWIIERKRRPLYSIDDGLTEILEIVWPARKRIQSFLRSSDITVSFGSMVYIYVNRPLYCLEPSTLAKLAWFGASYGMDDIADYRKDEDSDGVA